MQMPTHYDEATEARIRKVYERLSEKDRRLYAAVEALKFRYGGISYISQLLGCSRDTIRKGIRELELEQDLLAGS